MKTIEKTFVTNIQSIMETTKLYNGEIELCFNKEKHHYTVDGRTIDGVTSILGVINKPALIFWSASKASEFINLNLPVGEVIDEIRKKKLVDGCKVAHKVFKTDAADLGSMLHDLLEKHIKGEDYQSPINPILKKSFKQFLDWAKTNKVQFKSSERKVYSKQYDFCGTLDFTAVINGKRVIGDIKTSSGIWDEYWLQTAAYKQALQEEFPSLPIDHTVIVRCGKDGSFEVKEMNHFERNIKAFLGALSLYRWQKEMKFQTLISNLQTND